MMLRSVDGLRAGRAWPMPVPIGPLRFHDILNPRYQCPLPEAEPAESPRMESPPASVDRGGVDAETIRLREEWLELAAEIIRDAMLALEPAITLPDFRVSVGYPLDSRGGSIGATHSGKLAADGLAQVFLSPRLAHPVDVMGTLIHEAIHVAIGLDKGHGPEFRTVAVALGLAGKMTATVPSPELETRIMGEWIPILGPFPHAMLRDVPVDAEGNPFPRRLPRDPRGRILRDPLSPEERERRSRAYRMLRAHCPECGLIVRGARATLLRGALICDGGTDRPHDPTRLEIG